MPSSSLRHDRLWLRGSGSGIFASTTVGSTGDSGNIAIDPPLVQIEDAASIAMNSQGSGSGGNISLQAGRLEVNRGSITAETASAQGGNITLTIADRLFLRNNSTISATAGTAQAGGNGGNITIRAPFIIGVLGENSDITANAFTGRGGNITIFTNGIFGLSVQPQLTPFSDITASSQFGISGSIAINTLGIDPNRGLVALPANFADPTRQIAQDCAPDSKATASSFTATGRGGIPESPLDPLHSSRDRDLWVTVPAPTRDRPPATGSTTPQVAPLVEAPLVEAPLVEAQHVVVGADGVVELVAQSPNPTQIPMPTCTPQRRSPE